MNFQQYLEHVNNRLPLTEGSEVLHFMHGISGEAQQIVAKINTGFHSPDELRRLMSELTGKEVDERFSMFTPFNSDFGKNITLGKDVFINAGCKFQDQGGITIGDGSRIGPNVVIATLNHEPRPENRSEMIPAPVIIGKKVWIGANATIVPGVTIGDNAIIGAGAVVISDIPADMVAVGVPATVVKSIYE